MQVFGYIIVGFDNIGHIYAYLPTLTLYMHGFIFLMTGTLYAELENPLLQKHTCEP